MAVRTARSVLYSSVLVPVAFEAAEAPEEIVEEIPSEIPVEETPVEEADAPVPEEEVVEEETVIEAEEVTASEEVPASESDYTLPEPKTEE